MNKKKKLLIRSVIFYILLFVFLISFFGVFPGSDFVGGTFTYFGFVILSAVVIDCFHKE